MKKVSNLLVNDVAASKQSILDIGCGNNKVSTEAIGIDNVLLPSVDIVHDLNTVPYPFKKNTFDQIHANMILEHLDDLLSVMTEIHRILKPGGFLYIKVPYYMSLCAFGDPTHKRFFTEKTFLFFTDNFDLNYYTPTRFKLISQKLFCGKKSLGEKLRSLIPLRYLLRHFIFNLYDEIHITLQKPSGS